MDVVSLEPVICKILTAPGIDWTTISARRVRKQLLAQNPDLDDWIRDNKAAIDSLTTEVFTRLQPLAPEEQSEAGPSESHQSSESTQEVEEDEGGEDEDAEMEEEEQRPVKKPRKKKPLTDEEYAKQLSSEINGRTRSSRSGVSTPRRSRGGKSKGSRRNISAATVDSEDDGDEVGKRKKSSGGGGARGGFSKEYILSEPLSMVIQVERLSRPQVVKKLWEYIKGNDLQNPSNKREIICDTSLRAVFGQDKIDMFKMNKVLGQ